MTRPTVEAPRTGELIQCQSLGLPPTLNVAEVIGCTTGKLTGEPRFKVRAVDRAGASVEVTVDRDDVGYLHEALMPLCDLCEGMAQCFCLGWTS